MRSPSLYQRVVRNSSLNEDFADLSLVAISERFDISAIVTLDSDFNIYRRYRSQPFVQVALPE